VAGENRLTGEIIDNVAHDTGVFRVQGKVTFSSSREQTGRACRKFKLVAVSSAVREPPGTLTTRTLQQKYAQLRDFYSAMYATE
jgi:hypothetical protein